MAESVVSDVVGRLLGYLGQLAFEEIASYLGGRGKLNKLNKTMKMIQARLLDAERRREGDDGARVKEWLKRIKYVLYRLEDLFEEVAMAEKDKQQISEGKLLTKPLRMLVSRSNLFKTNKQVAQEAADIMEELEAITIDMSNSNFTEQSIEELRASNPTCRRSETHSFILEEEVIGRDDDKNVIVEMLLDSDHVGESFSVIPIVGNGGLGKTTLAQLAFNDKNVQKNFEVKGWACIFEISSLEELVGKILRSITGDNFHQFSLEQLQSRLREAISDKKFLLVLDDMWDEDRERWLHLRRLLCGGKQGSKIIVTSRSRIVAQNMGMVQPYELGGLPEDKSWVLFRTLAFREGQEERNPKLTSIGREIVKKCANVPLAIRTIAALLYYKDTEQEWEYVKDMELRMIEPNDNSIMSVLKLSYDHLPSPLKQCFTYCSLFPKDYILPKQDLIYLWKAQGYIEMPPNGNCQTPEDAGHGYFMELLRRSFFQEVIRDEIGDIIGCKMHDLMHDLARNLAGEECLLVDKATQQINSNTIWHVSCMVGSLWEAPSWLLSAKQLRSLLLFPSESYGYTSVLNMNEIFSSLRFLRTLDLGMVDCRSLPNSLGKLKLLRYLRLGVSSVCLPECITRLQNLQVLDLRECCWLRTLPGFFNKLTNLRHLHCRTTFALVRMPPGFGLSTSLQTLDFFAVGESIGLDALATLKNLTGKLEIRFTKRRRVAASEARAADLKGKKLTDLILRWSSSYGEPGADYEEEDQLALIWLQPPPTLKTLEIRYWKGLRFPSWGVDTSPCLLPNFVSIEFVHCLRCQQLPAFSRLPHLRFLKLAYLESLEYIENGGYDCKASSSAAAAAVCFPSLERLELRHLLVLKGWSSVPEDDVNPQINLLMFPCLSELIIVDCRVMGALPVWIGQLTKLQWLYIQDCPEVTALPRSFGNLQKLQMLGCPQLERKCREPDGEYQPLIQNIPDVELE